LPATSLPATSLQAAATTPIAETTPAAISSLDDLPLTPRFANLLTSYRNCVLRQVDQGILGEQAAMAREAMSACALSRGELGAQLLADIRDAHPALGHALARTTAEAGMAQLEPMIEAAAVDQAHMRYASTMY
jgi:hypothetical protein